jgi:hypothetical protein
MQAGRVGGRAGGAGLGSGGPLIDRFVGVRPAYQAVRNSDRQGYFDIDRDCCAKGRTVVGASYYHRSGGCSADTVQTHLPALSFRDQSGIEKIFNWMASSRRPRADTSGNQARRTSCPGQRCEARREVQQLSAPAESYPNRNCPAHRLGCKLGHGNCFAVLQGQLLLIR